MTSLAQPPLQSRPPHKAANLRNHSLRDDIIAYWSDRSESFDQSFGHRIEPGIEHQAWASLIGAAIGPAPRKVLELACGTGEVTGVLLSLGYDVTAIDFTEAMLERARAKHEGKAGVRFRLADAENTMEAEGKFDAVISRHLVWTLLQPEATMRHWFDLLRPGGTLVVLDGNWTEPSRFGRLCAPLVSLMNRLSPRSNPLSGEMLERHRSIRAQLPFSTGVTHDNLGAMLKGAGFGEIEVLSPRPIIRAQTEIGGLRDAIWARSYQHVFVRTQRPFQQAPNGKPI